jgi:hypothetical protein
MSLSTYVIAATCPRPAEAARPARRILVVENMSRTRAKNRGRADGLNEGGKETETKKANGSGKAAKKKVKEMGGAAETSAHIEPARRWL